VGETPPVGFGSTSRADLPWFLESAMALLKIPVGCSPCTHQTRSRRSALRGGFTKALLHGEKVWVRLL
jgi:hypothetical protein